ncbi:hypothetical protein SADUNF_Sadunf08G0007000 [Salix dunnii]|uniref:Uncharacterized protein n=1 Tax=Salix dunnii TaxID=1413687 RepID=A0A835JXK0_9ROSI|nr:hypothetical protein SADUNF_Sadunf08G0007000 [Salix dunnii]
MPTFNSFRWGIFISYCITPREGVALIDFVHADSSVERACYFTSLPMNSRSLVSAPFLCHCWSQTLRGYDARTNSNIRIGNVLAKEFLKAGDSVIIFSRSGERVESAVQSLREEFGEQGVWLVLPLQMNRLGGRGSPFVFLQRVKDHSKQRCNAGFRDEAQVVSMGRHGCPADLSFDHHSHG